MTFLRRYTNLASVIHILRTRTITLLDPANWDDRNDFTLIDAYKNHLESVGNTRKVILALCFTERAERYHYWRVFAAGADGCQIKFNKKEFLTTFSEEPGIISERVKYKTIEDIRGTRGAALLNNSNQLPFLKRKAFEDEREFRIIYVGDDSDEHSLRAKDFNIDLRCVTQIKLNPWMPPSVATSAIEHLRAIEGCADIKIMKSTLTESETWKKFANRAMQQT